MLLLLVGGFGVLGCGGRVRDAVVSQDASNEAETGAPLLDASADASVPADPALDAAESGVDATTDGGAPLSDGSSDAPATPDDAEGDGGGQCTSSCTSDDDCQNTCPPIFYMAYCCDLGTHACFVNPLDWQYCPLHPNPPDAGGGGCEPTGCPPGQMCLDFTELDPPWIGSPACFALPAACANDPSCACLAEAGACPGSTTALACDSADARPQIDCFE